MVTRKRFRTVLNALALYTIAALVIGYFGVNAYSGNRGLRAKQDLDQQIAELSAELDALKAERANWERRVLLLKPESIDPDMLDERARVLLNYADPRELTLRLKQPLRRWPAGSRDLRNRFFYLFPAAKSRAHAYPHPLPPCGDFGYWGSGRLTDEEPTPRRKMAVASNRPAAQPAALRRASVEPAAEIPDFNQEQELHAYRHTLLTRRFEEKAGQLYGMGLIGGFCHLYIGQEAVVIGMQMAIKGGDAVITGYRDHGHMLACGMDPKGVMAELTGRRGGYSKGKGGSMHMFSVEKGFFGGHGIVGAQVPLGTGLAFANKYRGNDNVSLTYLGDGAANQGQVYESFNMAKLWKLPVIYIIENNQYGMGTSVTRASATT